jgi:hypothetical protein
LESGTNGPDLPGLQRGLLPIQGSLVEGLRFRCFIRKKIEIRHGQLLPKPAMPIRIGNQMAIMPLPFPILAYAE